MNTKRIFLLILSCFLLFHSSIYALSPDDKYHRYDELFGEEGDFTELEITYPSIIKVYNLGNTYENRDILALKISSNPVINDPNKPDILFIAGQHAREWIAVATARGLAVNLVTNYATDQNIKDLVDNSEIWIVPMVNPDGYEYVQEAHKNEAVVNIGVGDLRKNKRDNDGDGKFDIKKDGVDLNRNWGHSQWGKDVDGFPKGSKYNRDTSSRPQDFIYSGPYPFS